MGLDAVFPPDLSRAREASAVALDKDGVWLRAIPLQAGKWRIRADLDRTDPLFLKRLIRIEDERFYSHLGVDLNAILRALGSNIGAGSMPLNGE